MNRFNLHRMPPAKAKSFIISFYIVGIVGFTVPWTKALFIAITPFALLLSTALLALYHGPFQKRELMGFSLIYLLGFGIEAVGVNTGLIFGSYSYGLAMGYTLFHTPLLIGINWLFLAYCATAIAERVTPGRGLQMVLAPSLMVVYDLLLEALAPKMDMWHWAETLVPLKNYLAWWIISFAFIYLIKALPIKCGNPLAPILFICQFLFLATLLILYTLLA